MFLLNAQMAVLSNNVANESGLMVFGIIACVATFVMLLWKQDSHSNHA